MFTTLVPVVIGVLAVVAAAASVVFFLRALARESSAAETDAVAADGLSEMRALGQRIETLVGQQQLQGATDRQHLAQKIDAVGEHLEQQRNGLSGLQNELRHEVSRRDAEMDEIRTQLASIQHAAALGAGSAPLALPPFADAPATDMSFEEQWEFEAPEAEAATAEAPSPAEPMGDGLAADFGESSFTPAAFDDAWDTGAADPQPDNPPEAPAPPVFSDPFAFVDPFAAAPPEAAPVPDADEPVVAAGSEFEPFDFAPPADSEDDSLPLDPPPVASPSLFEDMSFGGSAGFAFEDFTTLASPAASPAEAPAHLPPAPPSGSAWVARANWPAADAPTFAPALGADSIVPAFETPAFETPAAQILTFETSSIAPPSFATPAFEEPTVEVPPPAAEALPVPATPPPPPAAPPTGTDDLTVISTVTDDIQRMLYAAGVTSLDAIARWSRADACRISALVSVSEDTILNQWVFEAQAALFQSFRA